MKKRMFICIVLLMLVLGGVCFSDNIVEIANAAYTELQKAAVDGEDVSKIVLFILSLGTFIITALGVLIFIFFKRPDDSNVGSFIGSFMSFMFFLFFSVTILAILTQVYRKEIINYLKTSYQTTQEYRKRKMKNKFDCSKFFTIIGLVWFVFLGFLELLYGSNISYGLFVLTNLLLFLLLFYLFVRISLIDKKDNEKLQISSFRMHCIIYILFGIYLWPFALFWIIKTCFFKKI